MSEASRGHGWWPYLGPYFGFLLLVEITGRFPDDWAALSLSLKALVPAGLVLYFALRGRYPELGGFRWSPAGVAQDVALGLVSAAMWVAPFILFASLRPEPLEGFDPAMAGEASVGLVLLIRMIGYAGVTPFVEELFIRSFVMRYSDVYDKPTDFRDVPIARFTLRSFIVTTVVFTASHVPWEWIVCVPWVMLTNWWFYRRRHLMSVVIVHSVANASILVLAMTMSGAFDDGSGKPLSLWFFV